MTLCWERRHLACSSVLRLLANRFGRISKQIRERVLAITSTEELSKIGERVFQVSSIKELGLA